MISMREHSAISRLRRPLVSLVVAAFLVVAGADRDTHAATVPHSQAGTSRAKEEERGGSGALRVVCDDNYPPYAFRDEDGRLQGIVVDQWEAWQKKTGRVVELRGLPWAEAIAAFDSGAADVLDTVFATPERRERYDFTGPYAQIDVPVLIHKSISGIASPTDLRGLKIGVKEGDAVIGELVQHGISEELSLYPSYAAIIDAAVRLDLRVFCVDGPPALYLLYKRGADRDFRIAFTLSHGAFHRAVLKGRTDLLASIESGFAAVPSDTYASIERKWLGSELAHRIDLRLVAWSGAATLALIGFLLALAWTLRRRVAVATAELSDKVRLLEASEAKNRAFIAALPDLFFTFDRAGRYLDFSTSTPELLLVPPESFIGKRIDDLGLARESVETFHAKLEEAIDSQRMTSFEYELELASGRRSFEGRIAPLAADLALLVARDMTESRKQQELLRTSLAEKEVLLKEIHHRVKNNMQVISSLIQLQSYSLFDARDTELLKETQQRIRAMAQLHELLYRSRDLETVDVAEYLGALTRELAGGSGIEEPEVMVVSCQLALDEAVPLGLIANELMQNALKHAYPKGQRGYIAIRFEKCGADFVLAVEDRGSGPPEGFDPLAVRSMGLTLVRSLAEQIGGELSFEGPPGFSARLRFRPRVMR